MCWQWEWYQVSTAKLEPSLGAISPVVDLTDRKKHSWEADQLVLTLLSVAISWGNKWISVCMQTWLIFAQMVTYYLKVVLKRIIRYSDYFFEIVIFKWLKINWIFIFFLIPDIYTVKQFVFMHNIGRYLLIGKYFFTF